jgi:phosphoadenosine phosphosulfate reductase
VPLDEATGRELVARAADELVDADALDILRWADRALDGRIAVATSLQDAVVVDLAAQLRPDVDVVFLDTGYHFAETLGMRDAVRTTYPVRLLTVLPSRSVAEQDAELGPELWRRDPDRCCHLRKVAPLNAMLRLYDGWVTGVRRADGPSRADAQPIEWDEPRSVLKINPIVAWSDDEVESYVAERGVLVNPLRFEGYPSIGCAPCTAPVTDPEADPRAGRWAGRAKNECGLHL